MRSHGKYDPLQHWLAAQPPDTRRVHLTFQKIEQILGDRLPPSAHNHRAWWGNDSSNLQTHRGHTNSLAWMEIGWRVEQVNQTTGEVTFVRVEKG